LNLLSDLFWVLVKKVSKKIKFSEP